MKYCKCGKCGNQIDLRRYTNYNVIERGYDYQTYEHYATCPHCGNKQEVESKKLPLLVRWRIFRETCL